MYGYIDKSYFYSHNNNNEYSKQIILSSNQDGKNSIKSLI